MVRDQRSRRTVATSLVLAIALASLAGGCGGGGTSGGGSSSASTVTATETVAKKVPVPKLEGTKLDQARRTLKAVGLTVDVERKFSDRREGAVIEQTPPAGRRVESGARVRIVVSKGPKPPPPPTGPIGPLGTNSIGPLAVGAGEEEARASFGEPDKIEEVNLGQGPAPQVSWTYELGDGTVVLKFATDTGELRQYTVMSPSLATRSGVSVGSDIAPIEQQYGKQLRPDPIGTGGLILSEGKPGTSPALTFSLDGSVINAISGGDLFQPAGE